MEMFNGMFGKIAAVVTYACLKVAGDADRREEKLQQEREKEKNEHQD